MVFFIQRNLFGHRTNYSGRFRSKINKTIETNKEAYQHIRDDNKFHFIEEYLTRDKKQAVEEVTSFSIKIGNKIHKTIESFLISPKQLISEIGGQLGVWIGISVITLVEVIELLIDLCVGCLRRGRKKELETSGGNTRQDGDTV